MWSQNEVCIFSCINENNELISCYGGDQQLLCPNVNFFPQPGDVSGTLCFHFSSWGWEEFAIYLFDLTAIHLTCALLLVFKLLRGNATLPIFFFSLTVLQACSVLSVIDIPLLYIHLAVGEGLM